MATWIAHMRVAAHFMRLHPALDKKNSSWGTSPLTAASPTRTGAPSRRVRSDALTRHVRRITQFYLSAEEDPDRAFPYLSKEEMDWPVEDAIQKIKQHTENSI